ncbi:MAG: hydrolase, partial [Caulobacteraceae bacterium]|nr:hydrolase [Caulobacteraceae bacterium]
MKDPAPSGPKKLARSKPRAQYAALPYRLAPQLEILLVTSRETGRWVIPKGWPIRLKSHRKVAALEALEEAGVEGRVGKEPLGEFDYLKVLKSGESQPCRVTVFPLEVETQREAWREQDQRNAQWFGWEAAAAAVQESGLRQIIQDFARRQSA